MKLQDWKQSDPDSAKFMAMAVRVGGGFFSSIVFCLFVGLTIIRYLNVSLFFLLGFILTGTIIGFIYTYFQLKKL